MRGIYDWMHGRRNLWHRGEQQAILKIGPDAPACAYYLVRAMVSAYLVQLGEPTAEEDVDMALFDMRSFLVTVSGRHAYPARLRPNHVWP